MNLGAGKFGIYDWWRISKGNSNSRYPKGDFLLSHSLSGVIQPEIYGTYL